jgi:hypothetical protein
MFASEVVREWEMAWLQSDDRVSGDRPLRLVGEKQFTATLERTKRVDFSERSAMRACSRFRGVMS